ncbi:MAG TPA: helix-turn-helix transcriptional regulator [Bacteroidales bacterium]|nr:helix-turn-helix transcriptional regulator [Bacteroidales bacterium]
MKDRIIEFLRAENKSSAQFADEIGVQPSGISHIISGRNNPSLDFIIKMLDRYKYVSPEWLLFGKGTMYKASAGIPTLFDQVPEPETIPANEEKKTGNVGLPYESEKAEKKPIVKSSGINRIVIFYNDMSFEEYTPSGKE